MNKETEKDWKDLAKVIDKVYKKSLKDYKFNHDPDVGVFRVPNPSKLAGSLQEAYDNTYVDGDGILTPVFDEGSGELATSESHICVFFDPGVGQELWCKHEGCKEVKDRF